MLSSLTILSCRRIFPSSIDWSWLGRSVGRRCIGTIVVGSLAVRCQRQVRAASAAGSGLREESSAWSCSGRRRIGTIVVGSVLGSTVPAGSRKCIG